MSFSELCFLASVLHQYSSEAPYGMMGESLKVHFWVKLYWEEICEVMMEFRSRFHHWELVWISDQLSELCQDIVVF